jgi:hypothetical protein
MKRILFCSCFLLIFSCKTKPEIESDDSNVPDKESKTNSTEPVYSIFTTETEGLGWGYQILKDGKLMINQDHIPAVQGNKGFSSKEAAEKTANFMLEKIKKGIFPPTISIEELDSLEVLN